ncbi:DUF5693 family protein [Caldalkalibacillus salinus]|uniref:DUF5693 family protein n=1 Tax=Caldalkalibacillus salinus TaxID=2803787 RepID=UPI00192351D5|nr:DUF5693 family protein [Caldalkalibacillus salinus]
MLKKILWLLVIISILASIPLVIDRYQGETSTKRVEVVVDYDKVSRMSMRSPIDITPQDILTQLSEAGVNSVAVFENTVGDLIDRGIIQLYTTNHLNLFSEYSDLPQDQTLALFSTHLSDEEIETYEALFLEAIPDVAQSYEWDGRPAVMIDKPANNIRNTVLGFDFDQLQTLQNQGFHVIARIKTSREWNEDFLEYQFKKLSELGIHTTIFDGRDVLGYPEKEKMAQVADWMKEYQLKFITIEFHEQDGAHTLSEYTDHQIIRLLSVTDQMMNEDEVSTISNMLTLGIEERNVRMVYLNLPVSQPHQPHTDLETILQKANEVVYFTLESIRQNGYELGYAAPFTIFEVKGQAWHRLIMIIGALALASLYAYKLRPKLAYLPIPLGLLVFVLGQVTDRSMLIYQGFALVAAFIAPTIATIYIIEFLQKRQSLQKYPTLVSIGLFIVAGIISLYGALVVVSLLNHLSFIKYMTQFRGVKTLHLAPFILLTLYFLAQFRIVDLYDRVKYVLQYTIQVKHVLTVAAILFGVVYYVSRSGNEGVVLPFELEFRQLLNDLLGVRPRTKELLLGHPLFILASYFVLKYRKGVVLFFVGIIGQISMVSTFTHLHTPLLVSLQRTVYGMIGGIMTGLLLILLWRILNSLWNKRERLLDGG